MAEFPNITPETSSGDESRPARRTRRKSRKAANLGGLVAAKENLIWDREQESPRPKKAAKDIAEVLKVKPVKPETGDDTRKTAPTKSEHSAEADSQDAEHDAKLAELSPAESRHAISEYADVRGMEVAAEQVSAEQDSPEAEGLKADASLLEKIREKLAANEAADPGQVVEESYEETLQELPSVAELAHSHQSEQAKAAAETTPMPEAEPPAVPSATQLRTVLFPNAMPDAPLPLEDVPAPAEEHAGPRRNVISVEEAMHAERRAETRGLLVGGLVGYFIGRRRGRIKTERRLMPVQEKLEKQVRSLHDTIAEKEAQLRQEAARRHAEARDMAEQLRHEKQAHPTVQAEVLPRRAVAETITPTQERAAHSAETLPAGQMVQLAGEVAAATAAMTATAMERTQPATVETSMINDAAKELAAERVKNMSTRELLATSEQVVIGGERLRDIYESKRISEPGLRRVLMEYVSGGHFEHALQQEIHNKELTYERDPHLRKTLAAKLTEKGSKAVDRAGKLATGARPRLTATSERTKNIGKKVVKQAVATARKIDNPSNPMQQVIVRTWAVVTVVLAIIAVILLFR